MADLFNPLPAGVIAQRRAWHEQTYTDAESAAMNERLSTVLTQLTRAWEELCHLPRHAGMLSPAAMARRALADVFQLFCDHVLRPALDELPLYCAAATTTEAATTPAQPLQLIAVPPAAPQATVFAHLAAAVPVASFDEFLLPLVWACDAPGQLINTALRCQATLLQIRQLSLPCAAATPGSPAAAAADPDTRPDPDADNISVVFRDGHWEAQSALSTVTLDEAAVLPKPHDDSAYVAKRCSCAGTPAARSRRLAEDDVMLPCEADAAGVSVLAARRAVVSAASLVARSLALAAMQQAFVAELQACLVGFADTQHNSADSLLALMTADRVRLTSAQRRALRARLDRQNIGPDTGLPADAQCACLVAGIVNDPALGSSAVRALQKAGFGGLAA